MSEGLLAAATTSCPPSHLTSFIFLLSSAFLNHILPPHFHHQKQVSEMKSIQTPMQVFGFREEEAREVGGFGRTESRGIS